MLVVLATLALVALGGLLLRWSTGRVEAAAQIVTDLDADGWRRHAGELGRAGDELRDAMALREHR